MLQLATLFLLNLSPLAWAALPSFLANLEEDSTYHQCDSAMCWWTNFVIDFVTDLRVPNSSLVIADYDWNWWEVKMSSLLEECAPSLPLSQVAYSFSACNDIDDSSIKEACFGVQRDWLDEKGAINTSLMQMYSEMPKAESFINECLALDGDGVSEVEEIFDYFDYHDYDYYDYDGYYYSNDGNDLVEEKSGRRQKRSSELGELKARVKQREERRGRARKGQRNVKVKKQRNGKNGQMRRRAKEGQGAKEIKKKGKTRKDKKRAQQGKKKTKSRKQAASKKKERREEKRALKKIGLKKVPTQLVLGQLKCIWLAVDLALEDCGKEVLKNSNID